MAIAAAIFFGSLLLGQAGGIALGPGIVIYLHDMVLAIVSVVILGQYIQKKQPAPKLFIPILVFVVAAILSLVVNSGNFSLPVVGASSLYLMRWILYSVAYVWVIGSLRPPYWLRGLFVTGIGFAILGFLQFFLYPDLRNLTYLGWDPHYYRLFGTLLDPNFTGLIMVLTMLVGAAIWSDKKFRVWVIGGEVIAAVALLLTYSRSSFVALAGAIVICTVLTRRWKLLLGLLMLGLAVVFTPRTSGSTLSLIRPATTLARIGNWKDGVELIARAPIFGHGFNTLRYIQGAPGETIISKSASGLDSSILFIAATTGLVGIVAYGYLVFSMIRLAWRKSMDTMGVVYGASWGALLIHSLFVNSMFYPWILLWMWVLTGVSEKKR